MVVVVVGSDALLSSSPSLIWLSWGFGLAWTRSWVVLINENKSISGPDINDEAYSEYPELNES